MKINRKYQNLFKIILLIIFYIILSGFSDNREELKVLFSSENADGSNIYKMNLDGSNFEMVTNSKDFEFWPRWSNKSKKIVFCSMKRDEKGVWPSKIYTMDADGKNRKKLTDGNYNDYFPNWSFDGEKIVFQSFRDGNGEIYIMDADGKNQKKLTNSKYEDSYPSFSPDNKKIIFQMHTDNRIKIFTMNINGKKIKPVFDDEKIEKIKLHEKSGMPENARNPKRIIGGNNEFAPVFSSDGEKIYFAIDNYGIHASIYEYNISEMILTRITTESKDEGNFTENYVFVFPDNKKLLTTVTSEKTDLKEIDMVVIDLKTLERKKTELLINIKFPSIMTD